MSDKAVSVNTRLYRLVHKEDPRGVRNWGFALGDRTGVFWVYEAPYEQAKQKAIRRARRTGVEHITVLP